MSAVMTEPDLLELTVVGGLAGCTTGERYALVEVSPTSPLFRLCSLDEPGLDFLVVPPGVFFPDYAPLVDDASAARIGLTDAADALLLVLLTVGDDVAAATANLMAPIVIHAPSRRAAQVVVEDTWPLRAPLQGLTCPAVGPDRRRARAPRAGSSACSGRRRDADAYAGGPWSPRKERQMLVLTRRSSQSIVIGKDIVVTVLEVRGDQVRIGVSAPRDVDVHREEVFLELQEANRSAASPSPSAVEALGQLLPGEQHAERSGRSGRAVAGRPTRSEQRPGVVRTDHCGWSGSDQPDGRSAQVLLDHLGAGHLLPKPLVSRRHRAGAAPGSRTCSRPPRPLTVDVDQLVADSLPLVRAVVGSMSAHYPRHCDRDELVAAGTFGLVEAARRFDPSKGVPFERWAVLRIRGAVVDAVRALDFAPRALRSSARDLDRRPRDARARARPHPDLRAGRRAHGHAAGRPRAARGPAAPQHRPEPGRADPDAEGDTTLAAIVLDPGADPLEELERRERDSYVTDALAHPARAAVGRARRLLPRGPHLRRAGRSELGVTESRISQMRTEALTLVREGLAAQYGERTTVAEGSGGRQAGRLQRLAVGALELHRPAVAGAPHDRRRPRRGLTRPHLRRSSRGPVVRWGASLQIRSPQPLPCAARPAHRPVHPPVPRSTRVRVGRDRPGVPRGEPREPGPAGQRPARPRAGARLAAAARAASSARSTRSRAPAASSPTPTSRRSPTSARACCRGCATASSC